MQRYRYIFTLLLLISSQVGFSQSTPELYINGASLGSTNVTYQNPGNIISPTTSSQPTTVTGNGQVLFKAGESVLLGPGFRAHAMTGSGYFHALTATPDFEVVFIEPNQSYPTVGRFEKLELGIKLPVNLEQDVNTFLTNSTTTYLNPYDPDQISVEAKFMKGANSYTVYGFYYKEYERDLNYLVPDSIKGKWNDVPTDYNWRIRFAPPVNGNWTCDIKIYLNGNSTASYSVNGIAFSVTEVGNPGYLFVADDNRHFRNTGNGEIFIPIGQNIPWCDYDFRGEWLNYDPNNPWNGITNPNFINRIRSTGYLDMHDHIENLADNNGNLARVVSWDKSYQFEWEELGVYGSNRYVQDDTFKRQKKAWELDKLFEVAESRNIKLLYCLEFHSSWQYDYEGGSIESYLYNPYKTINNDDKWPQEFFSDAEVISHYKKKLRYFLSRWGYSTSLGILQYLSEFDGFSHHNVGPNDHIYDHNNELTLATNIAQWHDEIGQYVKDHFNSLQRPIMLTSGFSSSVKPTDLIGNFYQLNNIDLVIYNRYGNDRSENWEMSREAVDYITEFDKPFLYTETGLSLGTGDADAQDTESCDDVMFHNFTWAGATMGCAGTSLEWWLHFDDNRRENFKSLAYFLNSIDFLSDDFVYPDKWHDGNTHLFYCGNGDFQYGLGVGNYVENYYVKAKDPNDNNRVNRAFGWTHNLTNYWWNLSSYRTCGDRVGTVPQNAPCDDDGHNSPITLTINNYDVEIHGLKTWGNYNIDWYNTSGNGGIFTSSSDQANILGVAKFDWPGSDHDYGFKVYRTGHNFRESELHYEVLETDTIGCGDDTIRVEDPGEPGYTYLWNFGNGTGSNSSSPTVVYENPGSYIVTLIITDSLGGNDTIVQTIVKLECDSMEEQSMTTEGPQEQENQIGSVQSNDPRLEKFITIVPNPNNGECTIRISSPIETNVGFHLMDLYGKVLLEQRINIQSGITNIPLIKPELSSGIYFVKVDGFDEPIKMIITK